MISMHDLGLFVIGNVIRVTLLAAFALVFAALSRRKGPAAGATIALGGLMALAVVSLLGLSPWPRWWNMKTGVTEDVSVSNVRASFDWKQAWTSTFGLDSQPVEVPRIKPARPASATEPVAPPRGSLTLPESSWTWPAWVGLGFLVLVSVGLARILLGVVSIAWLRRLSRPIHDEALSDLAAILQAELSCPRRIELREVSGSVTPATFGWRRPVILLPADWRDWDETERRAVLAHEIAHVHRCDFIAGVLAQISLSLHFYHPLAHWLVGRLRLQQELAADAWGAHLLGGNRSYLAALATMALRRDDQPLGWPSRAFLPTRGTLIRRIEMLRDLKSQQTRQITGRTRMILGLTLAGATLLVAGLRGPLATTEAAQAPATGGSAYFDLARQPADAGVVFSLKLNEPVAQDAVKRMEAMVTKEGQPFDFLNTKLPIRQIEELLVVWRTLPQADRVPGRPPVPPDAPSWMLIRALQPQNWDELLPSVKSMGMKREQINGMTLYTTEDPNRHPASGNAIAVLDDRTVGMGQAAQLRDLLTQGAPAVASHDWDEALKSTKRGPATLVLSSAWVADLMGRRAPGQTSISAFEPLWTKSRALAISVGLEGTMSVNGAFVCGSEDDAKEVARTTSAGFVLLANSLRSQQTPAGRTPTPNGAFTTWLSTWTGGLLGNARAEWQGNKVLLTTRGDRTLGQIVDLLLSPAMQSSRIAARRSQSMNNMKQIGLALHNYYSTYGSLPPPVLIGPDGKTPYSWRVAILPYIEQSALYQQYKFDEPWDSPSNRKVLAQVPPTFRHPSLEQGSVNASYYVLTGPDTMFPSGEKKGIDFAKVTDGLSNTIMVVEAKREIPWTKPEDIPYAKDQPLPKFGGFDEPKGFNAGFGDGSVRFISNSAAETLLRALFSRNGGEIIQF